MNNNTLNKYKINVWAYRNINKILFFIKLKKKKKLIHNTLN